MKILRVIDTRHYEEQGDKWVAIPDSGDARQCDRCGRTHEIHFHVENAGKVLIVGGGCAVRDSLIVESAHKSLKSAASTVARLTAQLEALAKRQAEYDTATDVIYKLPLPDVVEIPHFSTSICERGGKGWRMDDADCYSSDGRFDAHRQSFLAYLWRENRLKEKFPHVKRVLNLGDIRRRLVRATKKIETLKEKV